ncbi:MAG: PAS domain-containing protein [Hyphomicrobiales bacterium]
MSTPTKTFGIALTNHKVSKALFNENPAWLWAPEGDRLLWANEAGCRFFGTKSITDLLSRSFRRISPASIEINRLGKSKNFNKTISRKMKFLRGMKAVSVKAELTHLKLSDGTTGVLVEVDAPEKKFDENDHQKNALRFIKLFSRSELSVALLSEDGGRLQESNEFRDADVSKKVLRNLAKALEDQDIASISLNDGAQAIIGYAQRKKKGALTSIFAIIEDVVVEEETITATDDAVIAEDIAEIPEQEEQLEHVNALADEAETTAPDGIELDVDTQPEDDTGSEVDDNDDTTLGIGAAAAGIAAGAAISAGEALNNDTDANEEEASEETPVDTDVEDEVTATTTIDAEEQAADLAEDNADTYDTASTDDNVDTGDHSENDDTSTSEKPTRFLFEFDLDSNLKSLSPEFHKAMSTDDDAFVGSSWGELAQTMKLDADGKIARHLKGQAIWTETSYWPLNEAGADEDAPKRVPISLTAMPVFDRNRLFQGFRGFGTMDWENVAVHPELDALVIVEETDVSENAEDEWETFVATTPLSGDDEGNIDRSTGLGGSEDASEQELDWGHSSDDDEDDAERFRAELNDQDGDDNVRNTVVHLTDQPTANDDDNIIRLHGNGRGLKDVSEEDAQNGNLSKPEQKTFKQIADVLSSEITHKDDKNSSDNDAPSSDDKTLQDSIDLAAANAIEGSPRIKTNNKSVDDRAAELLNKKTDTEDAKSDKPVGKIAKGLGAGAAAILGVNSLKKSSVQKDDVANDMESTTEDGEADEDHIFQPKSPSVGDATEQKVAAESVDDEPHGILNRLPLGLIVSRQRNVLFANQAVLDFLGYNSIDELIENGGVNTLFKPEITAETSDELDMFKRLVVKADEQEEPMTQVVRAKMADGSTANVDVRLQSGDWQGEQALLLTLSAHLEQSDEAQSEESKVSKLIGQSTDVMDIASDGIIIVDNSGDVIHANASAEALFGRDRREMRNLSFSSLFAEESQRSVSDYLDGLSSNGVASVLNDGREVIGREANGGLMPLFMTIGKLDDENNKENKGYCAVLRDITQWKRAEEELIESRRIAENANAQKSDFLAKVSHEIRTPLNAIIGFSEVMMEERFGEMNNPRYLGYARDIHNSGEHLISLVNDLLDLSKIEAGKLDLTFASVQLNELIREAVAIMQPDANKDRIIIRTSLEDSLPNVVADARSIRQIALNLLSNAVKFTNSGGQVIISTALEENGEVSIRVRDTGVGMSEAELEIALEPFRQVGTESHGKANGTGLGLPLTKALVEANRAKFVINSRVDYGTLIHVTFPNERVLAQ